MKAHNNKLALSVCKSCLLRHFESGENTCPTCEIVIHQSHPSHYVSYDRTMQALVYKLVPGLHEEEIRRREQYHRLHGEESTSNGNDSGHLHKSESMANTADGDCHRTEEHVILSTLCLRNALFHRFWSCSLATGL